MKDAREENCGSEPMEQRGEQGNIATDRILTNEKGGAELKEHQPPRESPEQEENQTGKVNLLDLVGEVGDQNAVELVRLTESLTAVILFTGETEKVHLHFCSETEVNGYVRCKEDCILCRIGRKREERLLLPVYLPASEAIGVLPVSPSLRPFALLPQLINFLRRDRPSIVFIGRETRGKYTVTGQDLIDGVDAGEIPIKKFLGEYSLGTVKLSSVYPRIGNEELAQIPEISRILKLKGINGYHQRGE